VLDSQRIGAAGRMMECGGAMPDPSGSIRTLKHKGFLAVLAKKLSDHRVRSSMAATVGDAQKFVRSGNAVTVIVKVESHYLDRRPAYGRCPKR
jgi:hypothetical protein